MADILYTYKDQVYANITNRCNCRCTFCIRSHEDAIGDATSLWHKQDPTPDEIKKAMDAFDFHGFKELVYCGYGEPTCALETLIDTARYAKDTFGLSIRVNTNGLGSLEHGRDIVPELAQVADCVSISLNAPDKEAYTNVTRPKFPDAYDAMLDFAVKASKQIPDVRFTIVDVLPQEEIQACQALAASLHVPLRIRKYTT
ncbi:TIGR04100 family radical SAM protein [Lachnospiraceae bacterium KGMB03038]|nr:TIGR04100 family radical SAM protein [Lachnospiraceae bacterium KGMB03038]